MIFKDYYKILGLNNNKVSFDEIKNAYREQAKRYHPDVNVGNKVSEERIKDINEAYKILSNMGNRKKYDRSWNSHIGKKLKKQAQTVKKERLGFKQFIQMFFGKFEDIKDKTVEKVPIKGENVDTEVNVTLLEAFFGIEKKISLRTVDGKMRTFDIKIPSGIQQYEKIRLIGQGKPRKKRWKKWRSIYQN